MNPRQRIAIKHPCQRAEETTHSRFLEVRRMRSFLLASILTVNR